MCVTDQYCSSGECVQLGIPFAKNGLATHESLSDAVNAYIDIVKLVLGVHEQTKVIHLTTLIKAHSADLTNASHERVRCFDID